MKDLADKINVGMRGKSYPDVMLQYYLGLVEAEKVYTARAHTVYSAEVVQSDMDKSADQLNLVRDSIDQAVSALEDAMEKWKKNVGSEVRRLAAAG